ncbi:MAG TPA: hypothetical protein VFQ21_02705 [Gemmatimonadota bacterium]|nr:hypothetical protein [Gemmatimonadota bacterium]
MSNRRLLVVLAVTLLIACDGYSSGPEDDGSLTGTYTGEAEIIGVEVLDVTFRLTEYLGGVTGTFTAADGTAGSIAGSISGSTLTFTITQTAPCAGSHDGTASIENGGDRLSGFYMGSSPCTGPVNANFVTNRT